MSIETTNNYSTIMRGYLGSDDFAIKALLLSKTKEKCNGEKIAISNTDAAYGIMCEIATQIDVHPFSKENFSSAFKAHCELEQDIDWDALIAFSDHDYRTVIPANALLEEYCSRFDEESKSVLVAEAIMFTPVLKKLITRKEDCRFTLTAIKKTDYELLVKAFGSLNNVEVKQTNIYQYEFINNRFDYIFCIPVFGVRNLADDSNFMCKELDAVALENLLLHVANGGKLFITMPARITFAQGKYGELRNFVNSNYCVKEISALPEGVFSSTCIKTFFLSVENNRPGDDDVIIRKYTSEKRNNRFGLVSKLIIEDETFVLVNELQELDSWHVDRILSQQNEDWLNFQASTKIKIPLDQVAEVFRGKNITQKDDTGSIGVINITNIGDYDVKLDNLVYIDEDERKVANYLLQEGDVLIPARGTALRTAIFHTQSFPCIASSNIIVIRPNEKHLNGTYLKIFLDSPLGQKMIVGVQQGGLIMNISYKDLKKIEIPVPEISEQQKKADEYNKELQLYLDTISQAEKRWNETLDRLREY